MHPSLSHRTLCENLSGAVTQRGSASPTGVFGTGQLSTGGQSTRRRVKGGDKAVFQYLNQSTELRFVSMHV